MRTRKPIVLYKAFWRKSTTKTTQQNGSGILTDSIRTGPEALGIARFAHECTGPCTTCTGWRTRESPTRRRSSPVCTRVGHKYSLCVRILRCNTGN